MTEREPTEQQVPEERLDEATFKQFTELIYDKAGISLGPHKRALVMSRLSKRMRKLQIDDFGEYYEYIRSDETDTELVHLLDAISTNVTQFYREPRHFDIFRELLIQWENEGQRRFRFWSAACSSGEEPYTMALTVKEALSNTQDAKILATDISTTILESAQKGEYEAKRLEQVPPGVMQRYFSKLHNTDPPVYRIANDIQAMITFGRLNLSSPPFPMRGPLDVIFCRNVMIYFDNEVRCRLLEEMYRLLKPGGYLMVGHSESLSGMLSNFKVVEPSVYRKPE